MLHGSGSVVSVPHWFAAGAARIAREHKRIERSRLGRENGLKQGNSASNLGAINEIERGDSSNTGKSRVGDRQNKYVLTLDIKLLTGTVLSALESAHARSRTHSVRSS